MYGQGVHCYTSCFLKLKEERQICDGQITNGPHTICTVKQGHVGVCDNMGHPVLLPPGMHQWHSTTLKFLNEVDLSEPCVRLGPYTIVTVDEGYAAITQDNGKQVILPGGTTTVLSHRNWKFEKFMSMKLNSDDLDKIQATSADNVSLHVEATVVWQVTDVGLAARMAADTMGGGRRDDIGKLSGDVLKQARASLAMYMAKLQYMSSVGQMSAGIQEQPRASVYDAAAQGGMGAPSAPSAPPPPAAIPYDAPPDYEDLYDDKRMAGCVAHANEITVKYGVKIHSINIISAKPSDNKLNDTLAAGALAKAQAEKTERDAQANARRAHIEQNMMNQNVLSAAKAEAEAERIRAEGHKQAANEIESSALACELRRLEALGGVLSNKSSFFFGADAGAISSLLTNPKVVGK